MKILSVFAKGFKGFEEPITYNFSEKYMLIEGKNYQGKTSIGEAITWGLFGSNLLGRDNTDSLLINKNSNYSIVSIEFEINSNRYKVTRTKKSSLSLRLETFLDNGEIKNQLITQKELNEILPKKDYFLSVFNPVYFLALETQKARSILLSLFNLDEKEILNSKFSSEILEDLQNSLLNELISNCNTKIKSITEQIKEKNAEAKVFAKLIEDTRSLIKTPERLSITDEAKLINLKQVLNNLKSQKLERKESSELEFAIKDLDCQIEIESAKEFIPETNPQQSIFENIVISNNAKLEFLIQQRDSLIKQGNVCSNCGQEISNEYRNAKIEELNLHIDTLNTENMTYSNAIKLMSNQLNSSKETFYQEKIQKLQLLKEKRQALRLEEARIKEDYEKYKNERASLLQEKIEETQKEMDIILKKQERIKNLSSEMDIHEKTLENHISNFKEVSKQVSKLIDTKKDYEKKLSMYKEMSSFYCDQVTKKMNKLLSYTTIKLFSVKSTGENKEDFKVLFNNKELLLLSNSERVLVGLEIANLINSQLIEPLPTFVDNGECILDIPKLNTQMIITKVKNCLLDTSPLHKTKKVDIKDGFTPIKENINNDLFIEEYSNASQMQLL